MQNFIRRKEDGPDEYPVSFFRVEQRYRANVQQFILTFYSIKVGLIPLGLRARLRRFYIVNKQELCQGLAASFVYNAPTKPKELLWPNSKT